MFKKYIGSTCKCLSQTKGDFNQQTTENGWKDLEPAKTIKNQKPKET